MPKEEKDKQKQIKEILENFSRKYSQIIKKTDEIIDKFLVEVEKEKKKK